MCVVPSTCQYVQEPSGHFDPSAEKAVNMACSSAFDKSMGTAFPGTSSPKQIPLVTSGEGLTNENSLVETDATDQNETGVIIDEWRWDMPDSGKISSQASVSQAENPGSVEENQNSSFEMELDFQRDNEEIYQLFRPGPKRSSNVRISLSEAIEKAFSSEPMSPLNPQGSLNKNTICGSSSENTFVGIGTSKTPSIAKKQSSATLSDVSVGGKRLKTNLLSISSKKAPIERDFGKKGTKGTKDRCVVPPFTQKLVKNKKRRKGEETDEAIILCSNEIRGMTSEFSELVKLQKKLLEKKVKAAESSSKQKMPIRTNDGLFNIIQNEWISLSAKHQSELFPNLLDEMENFQ